MPNQNRSVFEVPCPESSRRVGLRVDVFRVSRTRVSLLQYSGYPDPSASWNLGGNGDGHGASRVRWIGEHRLVRGRCAGVRALPGCAPAAVNDDGCGSRGAQVFQTVPSEMRWITSRRALSKLSAGGGPPSPL